MNIFETDPTTFMVLGAIMVAMWIAQFALAYRQMKRFYARLKIVRRDGRTAVGMSGTRYRGRVYGVLVIDGDGRITHAEGLQGWTVMARLRPIPELVGMTLPELTSEAKILPISEKLLSALKNASEYLQKGAEDIDAPVQLQPA